MKKRMFSFMVYALALTLVMYNCSKGDPLGPNAEIMDGLKKVEMTPVTLEKAEAPKTTPGSITASAKYEEVEKGISGIQANGQLSASLLSAIGDFSSVLTASEISTLAELSPATVDAIAAGGPVPASIKSILDKISGNARTQVYLATVIEPSVQGEPTRDRTKDIKVPTIAKVTAGSPLTQCYNNVETQYATTIAGIEANRTAQLAQAQVDYQQVLTNLATTETNCKNSATALYQPLKDAANVSNAAAAAALEAAKPNLTATNYLVLKAVVKLGKVFFVQQVNTLENTAKIACTNAKNLAVINANTANQNNLIAINAAYATAINQANAARAAALALCQEQHDQG